MPHVEKRLLDSNRIRAISKDGFSWIDRRFVRDGFIDQLQAAEILLYVFLCLVADQHGLSFYGDRRIARLLRLGPAALEQARRALVRNDLVIYRPPLYQVLPLGEPPRTTSLRPSGNTPGPAPHGSPIRSIGQILDRMS